MRIEIFEHQKKKEITNYIFEQIFSSTENRTTNRKGKNIHTHTLTTAHMSYDPYCFSLGFSFFIYQFKSWRRGAMECHVMCGLNMALGRSTPNGKEKPMHLHHE